MGKKIKLVGSEMYEYEIYPLVDRYSQVLREKCEPFDFGSGIARGLAVSLVETMKANYGVGLAANQVGISTRLFVMGAEGVGFAFFNPEIVETSGEINFEEGCLSFGGLFLPIKRADTVKIKYHDMNNEQQEKTFTGLSARIVLHEYDHMDGVVYTSKVSSYVLDRAKSKIPSNLKKLKRQREEELKQQVIAKAVNNIANKIQANQSVMLNL